ncbi:DUF222 domain-containing protein [Nocardioides sp. TF02-7]|uniref:DUF222 domain-containing protein n=1 Tax=Nocardioides sp. TF02-7 TaxID=2917724 RepID=UPI001F06D173|nr:DUF222 domain-containing protein [Nocardioides sp. TF02-7]UMG92863.1 13E12 repeat family protein [Nocardioides sp. TF02-7]
MSHSPTSTGTHPVLACARRVAAALDEVAGVEATFMPTAAKAAAIGELHRAEQRLKALRLKVMAASSDVAAENAAPDVGTWLAHEVRADLRDARADQRLAKALDDRFPVVAAAFADGRVSEEQAWVIVRAVDALPKRVGTQVKADAEETLVDCAAQFAPTQLRILGRHILHVVAPEIADEEDAKKLAEEEATAEERSRLSIRDLGDGTSRISGIIPTPAAKRLDTYLDALTSPRHRDPADEQDAPDPEEPLEPTTTELPDGTEIIGCHDEGDRIPYPRKLAMAFGTLLERLDPHRLPEHGGGRHHRPRHRDPRGPALRARRRRPRRTRPRARTQPDRRRSPPPGLQRRHHPRRPRHRQRGPRPRPHPPPLHPSPAEAHPSPRQTMSRQRLSSETAVVRDPPPPPLAQRRPDDPRQRHLPVRLPPPPHREPRL